MKKILITSGGTREYIDEVRVMTNISSGKLGAKIAEGFVDANYPRKWYSPLFSDNLYRFPDEDKEKQYKVYYLYSKTAVKPQGAVIGKVDNTGRAIKYSCAQDAEFINYVEASSVQEVYDKMEELVPHMDVVIQCMAISDFTFNRDNPVKLKSNDAEGFINYMRDNIRQAPKIISKIKEWNPDVFLVGFKFEVGMDESKLIETACNAKMNNGADLVIANDKKMMQEAGEHVAWICRTIENYYKVLGKPEIAKAILNEVRKYEKVKQIQKTIK